MEHSISDLVTSLDNDIVRDALKLDLMTAFGAVEELGSRLEEGDPARLALSILEKSCGMMLQPDRWDEPYAPLMRIGDQRTAMPADLTDFEVEFLGALLPTINPGSVGVQISDLLFLRSTSSSQRFECAREVIRRTLAIGLLAEHIRGADDAWRRAVEIALRFHLESEVKQLEDMAFAAIGSGGPVRVWQIAKVVRGAGIGREHGSEIIAKLRQGWREVSESHLRREILHESHHWAMSMKDESLAAALEQEIADAWWDEAKAEGFRVGLGRA